jgi:hypothetical protein
MILSLCIGPVARRAGKPIDVFTINYRPNKMAVVPVLGGDEYLFLETEF